MSHPKRKQPNLRVSTPTLAAGPTTALLLAILIFGVILPAAAQNATMTSSLVATQGETITYTVVITNNTGAALTNVQFTDALDPNTKFVNGSLNTSPLAVADSYAALGNVQITIPAPGVLVNDVDLDGVGPVLAVIAGNLASASNGNVTLNANGSFSYNPPRGFEGTDTFNYSIHDGEGFTNTGTVSISVAGMIWFVNSAGAPGGDGRLTSPFNTLSAFHSINNGVGGNPATNDNVFLYSGSYAGPLTLLNNQKLIGQGASASLAAITGLTPPTGSLALPATGGVRPTTTGGSGVTVASGNLLRGLNLSHSGGTALLGGSVGALTISEMAITNTAGAGVNLTGGNLSISLNSVAASGGANGIRLVNCTGSFNVTGDGASARNGTGGTIQSTTGDGVYLDNVSNLSLARMNINNCAANGFFGQNVNGLILDWCSLLTNGDATGESGIRLGHPVSAVNGLIGSAPAGANPTRIANTLISASGEMNVAIYNNGGTLAQLEVTNVISRDTRTRLLGADGFYFETRGNASATVNFTGCSFTNNFTQGIQASALGQSALTVNVNNCGFTNNNEGVVVANASDADLTFDLNNNRFLNTLPTGASGSAIAAVNATTVTGAAIYSGKIRNNVISGGGIDNHVIVALLAGSGNDTLQVANNNVNAVDSQFSGIFIQNGETGSGNPNANVTVTGNTISVGALGSHGIVVHSRITSTLCAEINGNVSTTGGVGLFGINVRQRDTSTFRLPGFAGPFNSTAAVIAFLQAKNAGSTIGSTVATAYSGGAACTVPLLSPPQSGFARYRNPDLTFNPPAPCAGQDEIEIKNPSDHRNVIDMPALDVSAVLTHNSLEPILAAARQLWAETGLTREQLEILQAVRFEVIDLPGNQLGASSALLIQLDRYAKGYGWFIDSTPLDDHEFAAAARTALAGRIDLLSTVLHEMGHQLGLADDYSPAARGGVMSGFLHPGERCRPVRDQALDAVPNLCAGNQYQFTPLNIGTLPAGKSLTITFSVTITNPVPPGVFLVSNQGVVTAGGGVNLVTDDPRTAGPPDPTITGLLVAPIVTTQPATDFTAISATLNGLVNPASSAGGYYFQYGPTTAYGSTTAPGALPAGILPVSVNTPVTGLAPGTIYHFRIVGTNAFGTNFGADLVFTAPLEILQHPANAAACAGGVASFSVFANAPAASYQWQRRAPGAVGFQDIPGASAESYNIPAVSAADDGTAFRVIVSAGSTNVTSSEATLSVVAISSPSVSYDFNSGLPANTAIYGDTYFAGGVLELNPNVGSMNGAFLTTDFAPGRVVRGFAATFKARLDYGSFPPADGFSFNWATDLPNGVHAVAEEGEGSGLRVAFDTFDNGFGEAPAIDVWWHTNLIVRRYVAESFLVRGGSFFDVQIRLSPEGLLDLIYACEPVFARLPVTGYVPQMGARFGVGSRTGGLWTSHGIDDLAIEVYVDPTNNRPRITTITPQADGSMHLEGMGLPNHNYSLEISDNLVKWQWHAYLTADAAGNWQFLDAPFTSSPSRFYRLRAVPQMPAGLLNWWRAEGDYRDSFGPLHGTPFNGLAFTAGQRGQAFAFDGTNHFLQLNGGPIPLPWTACFWVNRQDAADPSAALLSDAATGLKLEQWPTTRQVGFTQFGVADYYFKQVIPANSWTHLAFTATPGATILYVNGVAVETNSATINLPRGTLGSSNGGLADHLKGTLDETVLFNRALAPAEIQQVINATRGP